MCTIAIEALTPLYRTSCIKLYKNIARSRLFCRIAKKSIVIKMFLIYQATFLVNFLFKCFIKTQQISLLKLMQLALFIFLSRFCSFSKPKIRTRQCLPSSTKFIKEFNPRLSASASLITQIQ